MVKLSELIKLVDNVVICSHKMKDCPTITVPDPSCEVCMWSRDNVPNTKRVIKIIETLEL